MAAFDHLDRQQYINLETFRKNGTGKQLLLAPATAFLMHRPACDLGVTA